jgi:hypothetical protein
MNLLKVLPANLTTAFFKIATWANILAAIGVIGSVAQSVANQPLLNLAFGQSRGAALSLVAIAVSHAATTITAYSAPIGGATTVVVPLAAAHTETTTTTTT